MSEEKLTPRDGLVFVLLQNFIKDRFPSGDPKDQVAAAFLYADLINKYKSDEKGFKNGDALSICCHAEIKQISLDSLDTPGARMNVCSKCGKKLTSGPEMT